MGFSLKNAFKSIGKFFTGKKSRREQVPRYTQQQQQALNQLLQMGMQNSDPQAMEDRYTKQFQEGIVPGIAEQFTGMGGGAQRSSAFGSSLGRAGGDLASQLAAMRSGRGMQQLQFGLRPQFDTENIPGSEGFMQQALPKLLPFAASALKGPLAGLFSQLIGGGKKGKSVQAGGNSPLYFGGQPQGLSVGQTPASSMKLLQGLL